MYPNKIDPTCGNFIHNQIKYLIAAGCEIRVISPVPYAPRFLSFKPRWRNYGNIPFFDTIDKVPVYYPRYINLPGSWFHGLSGYSIYESIKRKVYAIYKEFTPHIIHTHTATPDGFVGLLLKKTYNIPLVCSIRGSDINVYPHYDKLTMCSTEKVISNTDQLVSVSSALKDAVEKIAVPKKTVKVVYNGCDLEDFTFSSQNRQRYRHKMNISEDEKVIIFVGELKKSKGIIELITAFNKLMPKYPKLHSFIVGNGPEYSNVKTEISANKLDKKVHLLGNQEHNEVSKWLSAADIFILPTHYEGLPNAVLEAMACGLPVIATNVGGIPEVVINGTTGILIDVNDVSSIIESVDCLIMNKELAKKIGAHGREVIKNKFSWERNAHEMINVYKETMLMTDIKS
jgi:teichuronic acid biosynthesis glycosyltransferase TuaC